MQSREATRISAKRFGKEVSQGHYLLVGSAIKLDHRTSQMPAKKRDDPRYKPFVGRMFTLRKHKVIPGYPSVPNRNRTEYTSDHFGEIVLVLDETNTRVRVCDHEGSAIWIPKFFLHKEIKNGEFTNVDALSECVQNLLTMAEDMKERNKGKVVETSLEDFEVYVNELERIANFIRQYADHFNPVINPNFDNE